jgi:hypothetical protein
MQKYPVIFWAPRAGFPVQVRCQFASPIASRSACGLSPSTPGACVQEIELFDFIETLAPACSGFTATIIPNIPEFEIGTTRMLTNQLGYVHLNEHRNFRLEACIAI